MKLDRDMMSTPRRPWPSSLTAIQSCIGWLDIFEYSSIPRYICFFTSSWRTPDLPIASAWRLNIDNHDVHFRQWLTTLLKVMRVKLACTILLATGPDSEAFYSSWRSTTRALSSPVTERKGDPCIIRMYYYSRQIWRAYDVSVVGPRQTLHRSLCWMPIISFDALEHYALITTGSWSYQIQMHQRA